MIFNPQKNKIFFHNSYVDMRKGHSHIVGPIIDSRGLKKVLLLFWSIRSWDSNNWTMGNSPRGSAQWPRHSSSKRINNSRTRASFGLFRVGQQYWF